MKISVSIKEQACERLLHFHPKKTIARELGISASISFGTGVFLSTKTDHFLIPFANRTSAGKRVA